MSADELEEGPYRPSCGAEGSDFIERFCHRCVKDRAFRNGTGPSCPIVVASLSYYVDDPRYPQEWRYDANGHATCTAFVDEGDGDGGREPSPPNDPAQLVLIADPTEDAALFPMELPVLDLVEVPA